MKTETLYTLPHHIPYQVSLDITIRAMFLHFSIIIKFHQCSTINSNYISAFGATYRSAMQRCDNIALSPRLLHFVFFHHPYTTSNVSVAKNIKTKKSLMYNQFTVIIAKINWWSYFRESSFHLIKHNNNHFLLIAIISNPMNNPIEEQPDSRIKIKFRVTKTRSLQVFPHVSFK